MAPVSRNRQPSLSARRRATELFPAPAGPSIVTTRGMVGACQTLARTIRASQPITRGRAVTIKEGLQDT